MSRKSFIKQLATACAVGAITTAPAAAAATDLRSPDARDAARTATAATYQFGDLRSPDTRDVAGGRTTSNTPEPIFVAPTKSTSAFEWGDAGIGAGMAIVLVAVGAAGFGLAHHRRSPRTDERPA